jgi:hypothetical protein
VRNFHTSYAFFRVVRASSFLGEGWPGISHASYWLVPSLGGCNTPGPAPGLGFNTRTPEIGDRPRALSPVTANRIFFPASYQGVRTTVKRMIMIQQHAHPARRVLCSTETNLTDAVYLGRLWYVASVFRFFFLCALEMPSLFYCFHP